MKNSELAFHRGVVISHFSRIETLINIIISQHYLKKADSDFIFNVLGNEQVTFAFRRNTLQHIMDLKDDDLLMKNLRKINEIRNIFAHQMESIKEKPWVDSEPYFKNPRYLKQKKKEFTAQELYDEFIKKFPEVQVKLSGFLNDKGVLFAIDPEQPANLDESGIVKNNQENEIQI